MVPQWEQKWQSLANIFMAAVEREIINRSHFKQHTWKKYIDDVFSLLMQLWNMNKKERNSFIELANTYHPTIKFTAEVSDKEITFLDTCVYKDERSRKESILESISPPATLQASGEAYQRRSLQTSENQLFKSYIWRKHYTIQTQITRQRLDNPYSLRN